MSNLAIQNPGTAEATTELPPSTPRRPTRSKAKEKARADSTPPIEADTADDSPPATPPARGKTDASNAAPPLPISVRREEAHRLLSVSMATFDRMDAAGRIPLGHKVGGVKLWCLEELKAWARHGSPSRKEWAAIWASLRGRE